MIDETREQDTAPKKSRSRLNAALAVLLIVVLVGSSIGGILLVSGGKNAKEQVVLTCGDFELTNTELAYYYWSEYFYFVNVYTEYLDGMLDTTKPLDEQMYDDAQTWQDYLLDKALITVKDTLSMVFAAEAKGHTMTEDYQSSYESVLASFSDYAVQLGFVHDDGSADVDAYLQDSYGSGASLESFREYLYDSYLASSYSDELYQSFTPSDAAVEAYYDAHAGDYEENYAVSKADGPMVNALILDFSGFDDPESMASTVYANWQAAGAGEDTLSALSGTYCSSDGYVREIYQGQQEAALNGWLFADGRSVGDSGVVLADGHAWIVMLTGFSDQYYWQQLAKNDLISESYNNAFLTIEDGYTFLIDYSKIVLEQPAGLYDTEVTGG